jgi:hypothetical protein
MRILREARRGVKEERNKVRILILKNHMKK